MMSALAMNESYMRRVILRPYTRESGLPYFVLTLIDYAYRNGRDRIRYTLEQRNADRSRVLLFCGADFGPSPMDSVDGDGAVAALLGFLTLRPGDTDADYFDAYTDVQREFCAQHAEYLSAEVYARFGER